MSLQTWQFWIDVGGTFTDVFAKTPDGTLLRHKLLSSGVTKGAVGQGSDATKIIDAARSHDPTEFWSGYELRLLDERGATIATAEIAEFDRAGGILHLRKPLFSPPQPGLAYELAGDEEAPLIAIRYLLGLKRTEKIPPVSVRLGTTRGTNALLTRRGARTAFVTTRGFADLLHIGYQNRPRLFDLNIRKQQPLFETVVEIAERVAATGEVLLAPDEDAIHRQLRALKATGIESLAICLLHATVQPVHELLVEGIAREAGIAEISVSHRVAPLVKIVPRGDTTVLDAYLNPVLRRYVEKLRAALPDCDVRLMTSAGGLVDAAHFSGKDSILSGPAGGVVGFSRIAQAAGFSRAIGFDMGGTSTDVARFDGRFELEYETEKAGVRVVAPMLAIETVAAGGGSICRFDGVKLVVGPESAGADPGPACYGRGGPLCVTDCNFYLGKIPPEFFPFPLNRDAVEARLQAIIEQVADSAQTRYTALELADGFIRIANANMVQAIRSISVAKGCDPREYVLVPFGGAAGQHACAVAEELGIRQVLLHPDAGLLSAFGIGQADHVRHRATGIYRILAMDSLTEINAVFARLAEDASRELRAEGVSPVQIEIHCVLELRYRGVDATLTIPEPADGDYYAAFSTAHRRQYGYIHGERELEIVSARVEAIGRSTEPLPPSRCVTGHNPETSRSVTCCFAALPQPTRVFNRSDLQPGDRLIGPAIVNEGSSTTVIDPGWSSEILSGGELLLQAKPNTAHRDQWSRLYNQDSEIAADPIQLELFNNHFAGIAEQMGITLRNTAGSVNVKERLDFSCAIFTPAGELVVNAPHIPVHLGGMSETVRRIVADHPRPRPGDVFATNDPYRGGSHLPDITVVTPVHHPGSGELLFFTASRAHHAEIGGITPGSMPPFSKNLAEEGVLIRDFLLLDAGRDRFDELRKLLLTAPYPSRNVADNLADLRAQLAANQRGATQLLELIERQSLPVVSAYMRHIQTAAEHKLRAALAKLPPGRREFTDHLDDGTPITVAVTIHDPKGPWATQAEYPATPWRNSATESRGTISETMPPCAITFDFTGTGPMLPGNLNANRAIVTAAILYVLRCLIDEDIPLNAGLLAPVEIVLPECLLNPPERNSPEECAAVVGGNVETSQRVVDVLLGALDLAAASQGTMNNLLFGDATFGYYETICGGSGATATQAGADAVHTHMTNTRLTDPEVLERRYPVRLHEFSIRRGSGGSGLQRGGDGIIRRLEFLRELQVSILSQRRGPYAPYGLHGGGPGATGRNSLLRTNGEIESLAAQVQFTAYPGDILTIETPGGGGWGEAISREIHTAARDP